MANTLRQRLRRDRLHQIQGGLCYYCDRSFNAIEGRAPVLEHFVPRSQRGRHTVLACQWCDRVKGLMVGTEYLDLITRCIKGSSIHCVFAQAAIKREAKEINRALHAQQRALVRQEVRP